MKKFLIIKQTSLGDILHSTVSFDIIKYNFPESKITFMVDKSGLDIIKNSPFINKIITFDLKYIEKNIIKNPFKVIKYFILKIKEIRKESYDYAFDLQGLERSALFLYFSKAKEKFIKGKYPFIKGFRNKYLHATEEIANVFKIAGFKIPYKLKMNLTLNKNNEESLNTILLNKILKNLIINKNNTDLNNIESNIQFYKKFKLKKINIKKLNNLNDLKKYFKIILLSPYTRWETKNWGISNFIKLLNIADHNTNNKYKNNKYKESNQINSEFLFIFTGSYEKKYIIDKSIKDIKNAFQNISVINLAGIITLEEFMFLISKSYLMISGDSFAAHAANALNIPLIVIFGPTDEQRVGPLNNKNAIVIRDNSLDCQKCYKRKCPKKNNFMACMKNIKPEIVYKYLEKFINID